MGQEFPSTSVCPQSIKQEWTLVQPFYERYRLLKQLLLSSATTVITTIVSNSWSQKLKHESNEKPNCVGLTQLRCCSATSWPEAGPTFVCKKFRFVNYGGAKITIQIEFISKLRDNTRSSLLVGHILALPDAIEQPLSEWALCMRVCSEDTQGTITL